VRRRYTDRATETAAADTPAPAITGVMVAFGLLLATSLAYGAMTAFGLDGGTTEARHALALMIGLECVDVVLVGGALLHLGTPPRWPRLTDLPEPLVWAASLAGLAVVLAINHGYHDLLRAYLHLPVAHDAIVKDSGITPLVIAAYCVQPAVVEELFFRYLALDNLRKVMNVHTAIAVSSLMFGMAHIGAPLSIPVLALVGMGLGYARVLSGRMALPMLLHGLHNALILALV
jgi:membrane protease YdiL (CAAX protease family)